MFEWVPLLIGIIRIDQETSSFQVKFRYEGVKVQGNWGENITMVMKTRQGIGLWVWGPSLIVAGTVSLIKFTQLRPRKFVIQSDGVKHT